MIKRLFFAIIIMTIISSCGTSKKTTTTDNSTKQDSVTKKIPEPILYRASNTLTNNLRETKLEVYFDWSKKWMYGKATITLQPHWYTTNHLDLNARGMQINEVSMMNEAGSKSPLKYLYENDSIKITLDRNYTRQEKYTVFIDYIAKPDELKNVGGSAAISSDKGLYFINADGSNPNKPKQIWTQGETQSNSVWMPTIDSPNQRQYQQISLTVDTQYVTLSNGLLISQKNNGDGTRTDIWKMGFPHAPYLAMMTVGKFAIVKDQWRGKEVNYYVESKYQPDAKSIFGNTPEMLECFSNILGVDYPWEKYSQIVVRDYVSGAMENTTATLHGDFLQRTTREMLDGNNEDVISHELFHQWFGDLVTCESWSNIPLNESFATYGEYIWSEYKYGRDDADYIGQSDMNVYMMGGKPVNLIRFEYKSQEELFDGNSYQKGGRILHMLRKYVGDDAFFAALKDYLTTNKFSTVESHQLRLSFEKITGEDLNWFWNQWFFNKSNPVLDITYGYIDSTHKATVTVVQKQDFDKTQLFKLPVDIDVYVNGKVVRHHVIITHATEVFELDAVSKPDLINFDAEKMLLCKKTDNHTNEEWVYMYNHAPLFLDRFESLSKCKSYKAGSPEANVVMSALNDKFHVIRKIAIGSISTLAKSESDKQAVKTTLIKIAQNDSKASLRAAAINALSKNYTDADLMQVYKKALTDSSYNVMTTALKTITKKDSIQGLALTKPFEINTDGNIRLMAAEIYADYGSDANAAFMSSALKNAAPDELYGMLEYYGDFLKRCKPETTMQGLITIADYAKNASSKWSRFNAHKILKGFADDYAKQADDLKKEVADMKKAGKSEAETLTLQDKADKLTKQSDSLKSTLKSIEEAEKDETLKKLYSGKAHVNFGDDE